MTTDKAAPKHGSTRGSNDTPDSTRLLIDTRAACVALALSPRTVWSLTNRRAIPSCRVGRAVRYCPDELRAWVAAGCPTEPGAADRLRAELRKGENR